MYFLAFFNTCAFVIYLFLGFYVLILDCKSRIHQLFFLMCISLSLGEFSIIPALQGFSINNISLWVKIGWVGFLCFMSFFNHFYILLTTKNKINKYILGIIYIPVLFMIYKNFTPSGVLFKEFYKVNNKWSYLYNTEISGIYLFSIYSFSTVILSVILIIYWRNKDKSLKTKKQSLILLFSCILTFLLLVIIVVIPFFSEYTFFGYHPLIMIIWIIGIYIAIVKYRFMSFTPSVVSEEIISNIDESIFLLDNSLRIIVMNRKSEELFNIKGKFKADYFTKAFIKDKNVLSGINRLINDNIDSVVYWIRIDDSDNSKILMDMKISIVKDKFGDNIGFLLIGKEVRRIKHLKLMYKITDREIEVIQQIINGCTNKEIGITIGITLRTVKAHITNIYNKLGVNNKSHLLAFLNDFNLSL